jgi:hypothetical protein
MSEAAIQHNIDQFNWRLAQYAQLSGKSVEQALREKAARLGYVLSQELRNLMPKKGEVTQERLDALKDGEGVHVRKSVLEKMSQIYDIERFEATRYGQANLFRRKGRGKYRGSVMVGGKRLNLQALAVKRELGVRESGRGFMGRSSRFAQTRLLSDTDKALSRFGPVLAKAGLETTNDGGVARLRWGGFSDLSNEAVQGLSRPRGQTAISTAVRLITADMLVYIKRKQGENANALK